MRRLTPALLLAMSFFWAGPSPAQVGHNKVTYNHFEWQVYHSPHFDIHYYPEEEAFLEQIVSSAESAYVKISEDLDHEISARIPLIFYKTHPEFEQTNITLQQIPEAVGAFAEPFRNRMVLPIDDPPDKVYKLITHELVHIFEYDILFAGSITRTVRSNPPLWIMEGLASFLGEDEDSFDQMVIRDAVVNSIVPRIQQLQQLSFLTYRFGNAVFTYIKSKYGLEGVRRFLFEYRKVLLTGNIPKAFKEALGVDLDDFNREFQRYLRQRYLPTLLAKDEPTTYGREIGFKRPGVFSFAPSVSPGGELIAVLANRRLELDLWVVSGSDGEPIRNLTRGFTNKYDHLVAEVFSGKRDISWSQVDDRVAVFARRENRRILLIYNARTGEKLRTVAMPGIALQSSPAFSPDGRMVAFAGNRGGVYDIYTYDLETGKILNRTDDDFVDSNPSWKKDGSALIYNRRINSYSKIFTVSATDATRKTQLTFGESSEIMPVYSRDGRRIYYSSDRNGGIFNLFSMDLQSAAEQQLTDLVTGAFSPVEMDTLGEKTVIVFTSFFQGRYRLYRMEIGAPVAEVAAGERNLTPAELEAFQPPLSLTVDEDQKGPYRKQFEIESPGLELGVTDDGTFFGNSSLSISDLLGDSRWIIRVGTISSFSQIDVYHLDLSRRANLIYHLFQHEDFFFFPVANAHGTLTLDRIESRLSGGEFGIQLPFSSRFGWESMVGITDASIPVFESFVDQSLGVPSTNVRLVDRDFQSAEVSTALTGDTTRFHPWGPFHGQRFRFGINYAPEIGGDGSDVTEYQADYRKYVKLTRRSSFAYRLVSIFSNAKDENLRRNYSIGGLNTVRGFGFRDLVGDRVFFQNLELRFPLIDRLQLPFGSFTSIRGVLFFDVGGAYYKGGEFLDPVTGLFVFRDVINGGFTDVTGAKRQRYDFYNSKDNRLENGAAAYGIGLNFRLGFLELNWVFSKRTDFSHTDRFRSEFYIGNKF